MEREKRVKWLEGSRVYLRPPEKEDVDPFFRSLYHMEGRRLTGQNRVYSREAIGEWLEKTARDPDRVFLVIVSQEDDTVLGDVELNDIDWYHRSANIRIQLNHERNYGQGYGTEALDLMLDHGFGILNLHRIHLEVFAFNERAIRAYEKLGFQQEGISREALYYDHAYHDVIQMAVLAREWRERKQRNR
ncbi:GNAT family N-acetyltransferase [Desmospora profundinema]|uniref:RimJ/RimL family protein N-acetyltransferase n=1 Tax=Desmospora profundinema TaxID=1571184 RepID=A0ABU1IQ43_9BACL|nr:GNAT family protein [Desmospora profundinema]MDR6226890.1 RimJ/RimL family protein N-acetyltransferase [Desmospora profundinema]